MGSMIFIFFHELGHALIKELDLPAVGPEEDVADEMATFVLIAAGREEAASYDVLLAAAESRRLLWRVTQAQTGGDLARLSWWDEHNLDIKHFYGIVCLLYGSDPYRFWPVVARTDMPEGRARKCEREFEKKWRAWETITAP